MAKRILELREFPFFFWGQNYMGLFEVWLSLPFLYLFGITIQIFTIVEIGFCILLSFYLYWIFLKINAENAGIFISIFFAIGHPSFNSHLTNVSENYSSSLFFAFSGFLMIYLLFQKIDFNQLHFGIGLLFGLAFYNREILILILPWVFIFFLKDINIFLKKIHFTLFGFFLGYTPAILHYFFTPHYKKLIRPSFSLTENISGNLMYLKGKFFSSIFISGNIYYTAIVLVLSVYGIFMLYKEKNKIVTKIFLYYLFGVLTCLVVFVSSKSFSVERYYFYAQTLLLLFGGYGISKIFDRQKWIFIFLFVNLFLWSGFQALEDWRRNSDLAKIYPSAKSIANKLKERNLKFGFCEYWAGYTVSYFSKDEIFCLIYLDKQSDFYSAYQVIQNRAEFYLFKNNSSLEKYFLKNKKEKFEKIDSENLSVYVGSNKTLDFLEGSRNDLLKELNRIKNFNSSN